VTVFGTQKKLIRTDQRFPAYGDFSSKENWFLPKRELSLGQLSYFIHLIKSMMP